VDVLKVDRAFVATLETDLEDVAIVEAIVTLAHTLGVRVVAEGVETAGRAARLQALGCDLAQGFYFARPQPAGELAARLAKGTITGELPSLSARRMSSVAQRRPRRSTRSAHSHLAERVPGD
jgi:predicted signal transduction protein with EAL and GGDEF domain